MRRLVADRSVRDAIVAGVADGMQAFRTADGVYRLPMPALVGSGSK